MIWLSQREGKLLSFFAKKTDGIIVEIGSYLGMSTVFMAKVTKNRIFAIDPHYLKSYKKFLANTKKYKNIIPIKKTSEEANRNWRQKIDLLNIDGNHEYKYAKQDLKLWLPYLKDGGVVVCHDAFAPYPEVWKAVREELFNDKFAYIGINDSQIFAIKGPKQFNPQRPFIVLASNIWHAENIPYFIRDFIVKRILKPFYLNKFMIRGILKMW